ncbi:MAG: nucleotide sugar dehydrogenase [Polyangiaceae bacterium]
MNLTAKIRAKEAHVVVMGVGWAGLPLAVSLAEAGHRVTGLDPDVRKVALLGAGESYLSDVSPLRLGPLVDRGTLRATQDPKVLETADAVLVCVPTPLNKTRDPDLSYIVEALEQIAAHQHAPMLVVLESTTYPGTTRDVVVPRLTKNYELGKEIFVAFSPERVDPGNREYSVRNTPKVIAGASSACLQMAMDLYSGAIDSLVPVSSTDAAELTKLLENTFRAVNIGLVNEIALMSRHLGVDVREVIAAAASKPFGFMPFQPGPGLGGQCVPVGPLYLSWKARSLKCDARFIELADTVNRAMPAHVVSRASDILGAHGKALSDARVLIYGVAYKRDVADVRESPGIDVLLGLEARAKEVAFLDPHVPVVELEGRALSSLPPRSSFAPWDLVIVTTDHSALDRERLLREASRVLDTRGALRGLAQGSAEVYDL